MISIIITAFKESKTIQRAIMAIAAQNLPRHEIIVIAPDKETLDEAEKFKDNLGAKIIFKKKQGHFNETQKIPEILEFLR